MFAISRRTLAALGLIFGLATILSAPVPTSAADDKEIANALRAGGLIIVLRHGSTFRDQADTDPLHYDNIAAQRNLNDPGKATARAFGESFRQIGVPVGEVYTSQFNRAYETAVLAGFKDIVKSVDIADHVARIRPRTSCRSRTTKVQSPRISSVGLRRSGTMTVIMPADDADRTPLCESSSARHKCGSTPSRSAALRKGSGAGFPLS